VHKQILIAVTLAALCHSGSALAEKRGDAAGRSGVAGHAPALQGGVDGNRYNSVTGNRYNSVTGNRYNSVTGVRQNAVAGRRSTGS
jgi:hypothetical protein